MQKKTEDIQKMWWENLHALLWFCAGVTGVWSNCSRLTVHSSRTCAGLQKHRSDLDFWRVFISWCHKN